MLVKADENNLLKFRDLAWIAAESITNPPQ